MSRRTLLFLFVFLSCVADAAAAITCGSLATPPLVPQLRNTGVAEYVNDLFVICTDSTLFLNTNASVKPPLKNATVKPRAIGPTPIKFTLLLSTTITSRVDGNNSEATLLVDDAAPSNRALNQNVIKGTQTSATSLTFFADPPATNRSRTYRITNIRGDTSRLSPGAAVQATVTITPFNQPSLNNQVVTVGSVGPSQSFDVRTCNDSQDSFPTFRQTMSQNAALANGSANTGTIGFNVRFQGGFTGAFRRAISPTQDPSIANSSSSVMYFPTIYNSESGFVDTRILGPIPGVATQGTRLMSRFQNVPAGVRLFVTTQPLGPGGASSGTIAAKLIAADANGAGPANTVASAAAGTCAASGTSAPIAEIPIAAGTAQAVWEVTDSSLTAIEKVSFGVVVVYALAPPLPQTGIVSAVGQLGPFSTTGLASDTAPAPRFSGGAITLPAFAIGAPPPPVITTPTPLPPGKVGSIYNPAVQFMATGFDLTPTWQTVPPQPAGLTLTSAGLLTGTPAVAGTFTFNVQAGDGYLVASKDFRITISPPDPITISPSSLPEALGTVYSVQLRASGGIGPVYTFKIVSGSLPSGLSLSNNGLISGKVLVGAASPRFVVQADDGHGNTGTTDYFIALPEISGISITTRSIPNGAVGADYSAALAATGGSTPYSWGVDSQTLPPGVTLSSGGVFSGKPTRAGLYNVSVRVSDSVGSSDGTVFSMTVAGPPLSITTISLTNAIVGIGYSGSVQATGGTTPYSFSLASGTLPEGLQFAPDGTISGTPAVAGLTSFTVQVTDVAQNPQGKVTRAFTLAVDPNPPEINTMSLTNGALGVGYAGSVTATGGVPPYSFSIASGQLPNGLRISQGGDITGTPTALGDSSVTFQVTDNLKQTATKAFSLRIVERVSITTNSSLVLLVTGVAPGLSLAAAGGTLPYTWSVTAGALPPNVSLDAASGALGGNPSAAGPFSFTATVMDANKMTDSRAFTGRVTAPVRITTPTSLPAATFGIEYRQQITAAGGTTPYRFNGGTPPPGLSIDVSGLITGIPTDVTPGAFNVTVVDADGQTATGSFTLAIGLPPVRGVTIGGVTDSPPANGQQPVSVTLTSSFPVPITGTVGLKFVSDATVPADDPMLRFSASPAPDGRTSATFTIPAGSTTATFPNSNLAIQLGTVSGTITLTITLESANGPVACDCLLTRIIHIDRVPPVIAVPVRAVRSAGLITVIVTGFSTPRELTQAAFQFTTAPGSNVPTTSFTVPISTLFSTWYNSDESKQFGGQFRLTQPFTIQGDTNAITNVSVTLTNSVGTSQAMSAAVQ